MTNHWKSLNRDQTHTDTDTHTDCQADCIDTDTETSLRKDEYAASVATAAAAANDASPQLLLLKPSPLWTWHRGGANSISRRHLEPRIKVMERARECAGR